MALDASLTQEQRDVALAEAMSQSAVEYTTNHNVPKMFDGLMQLVLLNQPSDPVEVRSRRSASLSLMLCLPPRMFLCTALQSRLQRR